MKSWSHNFACKILRNRQGSVAIHVALTASVIIGMAGLGAEITYLLYKHRQLQVVADAAALSAGAVLANSKSSPTTEARAIAAHLGFVNGANGVTITVNNPPRLSTHYAGDEKAIEVVVKQPQSLSAVKMFHSGLFDVKARATALVQGKPICLLALQTYGIGMYITGGGHNEIEGCGVAVNSSANEALYITGGAALEADSISIVGNYFVYPGSEVEKKPKTGSSATPDPYANLAIPQPGGCDHTWFFLGNGMNGTLSPGTYCNGLTIAGGSRAQLNPGVYIIKNGDFRVSDGTTVVGSGVTFVLTGDSPSQVGTVYVTGGNVLRVSAPTTGSTAGLVFIQDPKVITSGNKTAYFNGGASQIIKGAIYVPKNEVNYAGGNAQEDACFQLIANTLNFSNGQTFHIECEDDDMPSSSGNVMLVE